MSGWNGMGIIGNAGDRDVLGEGRPHVDAEGGGITTKEVCSS